MTQTGPLTTSQVARLADVSINTVLRAYHNGDILGRQVGTGKNGVVIFEADEVAEWIASRVSSSTDSSEEPVDGDIGEVAGGPLGRQPAPP